MGYIEVAKRALGVALAAGLFAMLLAGTPPACVNEPPAWSSTPAPFPVVVSAAGGRRARPSASSR